MTDDPHTTHVNPRGGPRRPDPQPIDKRGADLFAVAAFGFAVFLLAVALMAANR